MTATRSWADKEHVRVKSAYAEFKSDPSTEVFTRWAISRDLVYHLRRFGTLVDSATFEQVARVLEWSAREKKDVKRISKEPQLVRLWSERCLERGELPPPEVVDGYLLSSLLRGRYYKNLAETTCGNYVWHSFRNYVLEPVAALNDFVTFQDRLVELYLAGIICRGAMEEQSEQRVITSWAENVRKLKSRCLLIPRECDPERAKGQAVEIARKCGLVVRWRRLDRILEGTVHSFMTLLGIAAGTIAYAGTGSHVASVAAHVGTEQFLRPYAESVADTINKAASGSTIYLSKFAERGAQRVFAVTTADLKAMQRTSINRP